MTLKAKQERNLCLQVICTLALKQLFGTTRKYPIGCLPFAWANWSVQDLGKWLWAKFLGLENFIAESHVYHSFVQINSIYRKTAEKAWIWYQTWLWRNETRLSVGNIQSGETGLPFQTFHCSRTFSAGTTQKVALYLFSQKQFSNRRFRKRFVKW